VKRKRLVGPRSSGSSFFFFTMTTGGVCGWAGQVVV
jgi:hypothetical protein